MARYNHPNARPNVGRIRHPFRIGLIGTEVALEQVFRYLSSFLTFRGDRSMGRTPSSKSQLTHETSNSLACTTLPLVLQVRMDTWTGIRLSIGLESLLNGLGSLGIISAVLAG